MRVLLVEDDSALRLGIRRLLEGEGWRVDAVGDGDAALAAAATETYDVVVLDVNLPRRDGFGVLGVWRQAGNRVPVLMLTARDELADRVRGLDAGADDYLAKPFESPELIARLRAISRRARGSSSNQVQLAGLRFDLLSHELLHQDQRITLTPREAALLELLFATPGAAVPKARIVSAMSSWESDFTANAVEIYVLKLRRKLSGSGVNIVTVRGVGYALEQET